MRKSVLVIVALAGIIPVWAGDRGATDMAAFQARNSGTSIEALYNQCTRNQLWSQAFCAGYISGLMDSMGMIGPALSPHAFRICPKVSVDAGAAIQAFKNWAQKHPEAWSLDRTFGVMWTLKETWPCQ